MIEQKPSAPARVLGGPASAVLYNLCRLRTDTWNQLRDGARRLRRVSPNGEDAALLKKSCAEAFDLLHSLESYCSFPGRATLEHVRSHFERGNYEPFARQTIRVVRLMTSGLYRRLDLSTSTIQDYADLLNVSALTDAVHGRTQHEDRPYFEVLVVDDLLPEEEDEIRQRLRGLRRRDDDFLYELVTVRSFEDALIAAMVNPNIQACVVRYSFPFASGSRLAVLPGIYTILQKTAAHLAALMPGERSLQLGEALRRLRPELDLYLVTDSPVQEVAAESSRPFRRVLYLQGDYQDLHLSILKGIHERFETPFFNALRRYSQKPTGVFHALPISRGRTIAKSHWIEDMGRFYGSNIFQAETSATTGGLDSLLQPQGSLKNAQELAARAFGSRHTYFVTNGTSTANKIVMQALTRPGDIVLLAHDCHKSHPYAVILAGAHPVYMDAYPLTRYSMYGAVPLEEIKRQLLHLRAAGKLDRVRMLLLTNITFDGITYDPERVMEEVLAIKPDMVFVWDEAWFAYGRFSPTLRRRTAMEAANRLRQRFRSRTYREQYEAWKAEFDRLDPAAESTWLERRLLPDPEKVLVRVYATQSTHKTLTALRQGSMIHVNDQAFEQTVRSVFNEAYMTHTSTSPNYQILASLDIGRRQVELEGFELVQESLELAMTLRERLHADPLLSRYFQVLGPAEMVPGEYRPSGLRHFYDPREGWSSIEHSWQADEFVLDPTRVTIDVGRTGMDGDSFKKLLMDRFDIQINKTSRNTVLFMINIGMSRGTIAHLVKALTEIAEELDDRIEHQSAVERRMYEAKVASLTDDLPPLPNFSRFHRAFLPSPDSTTPEGDIRSAFFLSYDDAACEYLKLDGTLTREMQSGREVVSACFVTPYPPGFPIMVPGQVFTPGILAYLRALDVKEIHGYEPDYGLRVFTEAALAAAGRQESAAAAAPLDGGENGSRNPDRRKEAAHGQRG